MGVPAEVTSGPMECPVCFKRTLNVSQRLLTNYSYVGPVRCFDCRFEEDVTDFLKRGSVNVIPDP